MVHFGESRFLFDDKIRFAKPVPLGELIFLDRERCIQCARCTRFQDEIVGDPVIGFYERGRRIEIVTYSDPGCDSYFSGNTTDICPVGALTTADFRFGARPWELNSAASICPHCPVGCNLTLSTRREARGGGRDVVKRVMPRQNEHVNEIWICDKGRFAHHYARDPERLTTPLVRKNGKLARASWKEALTRAAEGLKEAGTDLVGVASGRLTNEDLYSFRVLLGKLGGKAILSDPMAGGNFVQRYGIGLETNLSSLGRRDSILVIATDRGPEPVCGVDTHESLSIPGGCRRRGAWVRVGRGRCWRPACAACREPRDQPRSTPADRHPRANLHTTDDRARRRGCRCRHCS